MEVQRPILNKGNAILWAEIPDWVGGGKRSTAIGGSASNEAENTAENTKWQEVWDTHFHTFPTVMDWHKRKYTLPNAVFVRYSVTEMWKITDAQL